MNKPQSLKPCQRRWLRPQWAPRLSSGKKASEVAAELNVSGWSLDRWRRELEQ